jgi:hypothetical protein
MAGSTPGISPVVGDEHKHADHGFIEIFKVHYADSIELEEIHTNNCINVNDENREKTKENNCFYGPQYFLFNGTDARENREYTKHAKYA